MRVININSDKAHGLLGKCRILREYGLFVEEVRKYADDEGRLKRAINTCIDRGILSEYLKRKGSEVRNMLIAEYSYEKDIQVKQQEAGEIGRALGRKEGRREGREEERLILGQIFRLIKKSPDLTDNEVSEALGCTPEDVENARKIFEI